MTLTRRVHARLPNGLEIVRYEPGGKWYEESGKQRKVLKVQEAAQLACLRGAEVFFGLPGGQTFDRKVRWIRGF